MREFELQFSDKLITPWGGMALMKRLLDHLGFDRALNQAGLPQPGSNRGYQPAQLMLQMMLAVWCGANRFEHAEVTRFDRVLGAIFGFARMANFKAITRLFAKFSQPVNDAVFGHLQGWLFAQVKIGRVTLDLDSTVITRYGGQQQGAAKGYNASKPGRLSHHPLMAFVADVRMVANLWLRPGNTGSANNVINFLEATRANLGDQKIGLLRADSGFSEEGFVRHLEQARINFIIALKLNYPLQRELVRAAQSGGDTAVAAAATVTTAPTPSSSASSSSTASPSPSASPSRWWTLDDGIELCELEYQAPSWSAPRRVIGIRQHIKTRVAAKGKTLSLFAHDETIGQWRYGALVTDLHLPAQAIWRLYRGRADCENRIKELKYDFAAGSLSLRDFWATEAALHTVMLAFNLMSLFRQVLLKQTVRKNGVDQPIQHTLSTLRHQLFAQPGFITHEGRSPILKLATAMQQREWIEGLWNRAKQFDLPVHFSPQFSPPDSS